MYIFKILNFRLPDDLMLRRSHSGSLSLQDLEELKGTNRRGSGTARRSFISRWKHKRNNSKDSREFTSSSDAPLNSESNPALDGKCRVSTINLFNTE